MRISKDYRYYIFFRKSDVLSWIELIKHMMKNKSHFKEIVIIRTKKIFIKWDYDIYIND